MRYNLPDGQTIETFTVDGGATEFVTRNAAGEAVSTVRPSPAVASALLAKLEASGGAS